MHLAFITIVLYSIKFTHGFDWNEKNWAEDCDFEGNDLDQTRLRRNECRDECVSTPECTHYTWSNEYSWYQSSLSGICSMKTNGASQSDAVARIDVNIRTECGIVDKVRSAQGIIWSGTYWAHHCDFKGNDLTNEWSENYECRKKCMSTPGCTHYAWTKEVLTHNQNVMDHPSGICWMKKNGAALFDAIRKSDRTTECGILKSGIKFKGNSTTTSYWDCCKPSCSWSGKAPVTKPVASCTRDGDIALNDSNVQSGCDDGDAFTCNNYQPWKISENLSYGYAAARIIGYTEADLCCRCFECTFTSEPIIGKKMIVQVTNTNEDSIENRFDLQIQGYGRGYSDGCSSQWGAVYDTWRNKAHTHCYLYPSELLDGCLWRFRWFENAKNPNVEFAEVQCPKELISYSGCERVQEQ